MALMTGPGPYRTVRDEELRYIFYLTPQTGRSFMLSINVGPFPGSERPEVTGLLRAMLYVLRGGPQQAQELRRAITAQLQGRELIPIRQKLLSLVNLVREESFAFPACVDTQSLLRSYQELKQVSGYSDTAANTLADPMSNVGVAGAAGKFLSRFAGAVALFGLQLVNYFGGRSKDYYDFLANRSREELIARGYAPSRLER